MNGGAQASMERVLFLLAAADGFLGVAFGAFGAHGMKKMVATFADAEARIAWWQTGAHYHLIHACAIFFAAIMLTRTQSQLASTAGFAFAAGTIFFSGSLYAMAITGQRALGAITPIGGLCFLGGWALLFISAFKMGVK